MCQSHEDARKKKGKGEDRRQHGRAHLKDSFSVAENQKRDWTKRQVSSESRMPWHRLRGYSTGAQ